MPASGMFHGDRLAAPGRPEPAHAMGQACGPKADLRIAEALADLTEDAIRCDTDPIERDLRVTTGRIRIDRLQHPLDAKTGRVDVDKEHSRSDILATGIKCARH